MIGIKAKLRLSGQWIKSHVKLHAVIALAVLFAGVAATIYYWQSLRRSVQSDIKTAHARQLNRLGAAASDRIQLYENLLRGSAGLFTIHPNTTQADWDAYHQPYDIRQKLPDIESVGVYRYLTKADVPAFIERRKAQGETDYKIMPEGERDIYTPVVFDARYTGGGKAHGYDSYADPIRRKAINRALRTGKPAMSGIVVPASQEPANRVTSVLYFPIYQTSKPIDTEQQRQAAILGFVYIAIDLRTLLEDVLSITQSPHSALKVYDATTGKLAYQSDNFKTVTDAKGALIETADIQPYGQPWRVTFAVSPEVLSPRERQLPNQALQRGLMTCIFFAGLVWYLITDRERKYARQKQREVQTAKDDLLSLASHQLRTPATVVKQYVGMLLQGYGGKISARQVDMLTHAFESNERQLEIINQLLYAARLDAGRITLRKKSTNLTALLRGVADDQSEALRQQDHKLVFALPEHPLKAAVDPHYMRMVFENLLSNAIKYTPKGGIITLSARGNNDEIIISVSDNGVGIDPDAQQVIFEKFSRIENELSSHVNGSGVGLYLTQQIIQLHKGSIEVTSDVGQGATFTVRIPCKTAPVAVSSTKAKIGN